MVQLEPVDQNRMIAKFDGLNDVIKACFNIHSII